MAPERSKTLLTPSIFFLTVMLTLTLLGVSPRQSQATTYYVTTTGTGNGSSWGMAGPLQTIITAAHPGDQVWVKFGTYTGNFTATDGVAVYGHFAGTETSLTQRQLTNTTYATILDGNNSGTIYTIPSAATETNTIDGFTVENGADSGLLDDSSDILSVANCTFTSNSAPSDGAGIHAQVATITNCTFTNNNAPFRGGAIYGLGATNIADCTFVQNNAQYGGAIDTHVTTEITSCTFTSNTASQGGGSIETFNSDATIAKCTFEGDTALYAGSIFVENSTGNQDTIADCKFMEDSPSAIGVYDAEPSGANCVVKDNLIVGAGISSSDSVGIDVDAQENEGFDDTYAVFANNTIVNTAIGIDLAPQSGEIRVANNVLDDNGGGLNYNSSVPFTSSHNDVYGNAGYGYQGASLGTTDLSWDPMFVSAGSGNYRLSSSSLLIDAGDDSYVMSGDIDLDGHARIQGTAVDIGCYEFNPVAATITSLSPNTIQAGHIGFTLTVAGTGFVPRATVDLNGTMLSTTYGSPTQLTATVPASDVATVGTANVTAVNPGAPASNSLPFTVTAAAMLTSLSPTAKPAGSAAFTMTVTGTNFLPSAVAYWNGAALTTTEISSTELTATVPASDVAAVGTAYVTAANPQTGKTNSLPFMTTTPTAGLTGLSPSSAPAGSTAFVLTVNGTGFYSKSTVEWNGIALATTYASGTQLTLVVPESLLATAGTASVTVVNPNVEASNALTFTITAVGATWTAAAVSAAPGGGSHILWTRSDGAAGLWTLSAAGVQTAVGPTYGPYPGWTASAVATGSDGTSRVLWTNVNGEASVWTISAADTETTEGPTYGPYSGWSAKSVGVSGDGTSRVLWTNTNGMAGVWSFNAADVKTVVGPTYGPYTGWSAQSLATDPSGNSRVLWDNANGTAGLWSLGVNDAVTITGAVYGPYSGWTAKAVGAAGDGTARVLWTNTNGEAGVWSFNAAGVQTIIGPTYGPFSGYTAAAFGVSSDGTSRVLWDNVSRAAGVWSFGSNGVRTVVGTVYGPY